MHIFELQKPDIQHETDACFIGKSKMNIDQATITATRDNRKPITYWEISTLITHGISGITPNGVPKTHER